ncbi:hypothetical protein XH83_31960 [Bradyrhizobium sp. CCBAU 53351]|nr:hypothetical protein XH83_31960 [Bradyrhizobium sp. CCBAU 53351]
MAIDRDCRRGVAALPLPLAGEGWGEGASAMGLSEVYGRSLPAERAPTRRFAPTSPASGRGYTELADTLEAKPPAAAGSRRTRDSSCPSCGRRRR